MSAGTVLSIHIAPAAAAPMVAVESIRAVAGQGLEGDRYFTQAGTFSDKLGADREVTLIEAEALEALAREAGVALAPGASRRNIMTRGVSLNELVNVEFQVGAARLRGLRLCEPCAHLEKLTQPGVLKGLVHRGGLRAQILTSGAIQVGDAVVVAESVVSA